MRQFIVFGKGGVGKSTISANLSLCFSLNGDRVLHIGCDPKHDSCRLLADGKRIATVIERDQGLLQNGRLESLVVKTRHGVDCIESGGPPAGIGCGGRGIARAVELINERGLLNSDLYDTVIFDVLGDVVCGGFAAPLRFSKLPRTVFIVVSEGLMSLYAANNICKAVVNYAQNNIRMGGLIANIRDPNANVLALENFAAMIGVEIVHTLCWDENNREAEFKSRTIVEVFPDSALSKSLVSLSGKLLKIDSRKKLPVPKPLDEDDFFELSKTDFVKNKGATAGKRK